MLYLASASPRRLALLRQLGLQPQVVVADIDESPRPAEHPAGYVERLAREKAAAVVAALAPTSSCWLLAADTTVMAGGQILGKPQSLEDARRIWALLPAPDHQVLTGIALWHDGVITSQVVATQVDFAPIPPHEQLAYWATGEPADKAGAYAIQGRAAQYVRAIHGSYSNVVGLPLAETAALLRASGFPLWE